MRMDYIPQDEGAEAQWAQHLKDETAQPANAAGMGWNAATVTAVEQAAQTIVDAIGAKEAAHQTYLAAVAAADGKIATAEGVIRSAVATGKEAATYTESLGLLLGVVGPESNFDPETYVAELRSAEATGPAQVRLKFGKARGHVDAVKAQMRRGGGAWATVGMAMRSPWVDTTPLVQPGVPENREYRIRAVVADAEIGQPSPTFAVTVG